MMVVFWWFIHLLGTFPVVGGDELGGVIHPKDSRMQFVTGMVAP